MLYISESKEGKTYVDQQSIKSDITDILFDIEDKKVVNKLRGVLKAWTKADKYSRDKYNEESSDSEI